MPDVTRPTRNVLAEVVTALVQRHGGPTRVGARVGADRTTVHRWMRGDIGIDKLGALAERLNEPLVIRLGPDTTKEPPPDWAEAMESRIVSEVVANREALYAALAKDLVDSQLGRTQQPDEPLDGTQDQPPAGAGPMPEPQS